jgi:hypothetical protein
MNWYLTKMIFRIICGNGNHRAQFDEQIRLIQAPTPEEAYGKAMAFARAEGTAAENNPAVRWEFVNIAELLQLNGLVDGAELYSKVKEEDDPSLYEQLIHRRAAMLKYNLEHKMIASL